MLPLSDGIPRTTVPIVNVLLIVANFPVCIFYELPHLNTRVYHASFYPCSVDGACRVRALRRSSRDTLGASAAGAASAITPPAPAVHLAP